MKVLKKTAIILVAVAAALALTNIGLFSSELVDNPYFWQEPKEERDRMESPDRIKSQSGKPNYMSNLILVNKSHELPADFVPDDLVVPDVRFSFTEDLPKKKMRKEAAQALEKLFRQAQVDGIDLAAVSGFRSYDRQADIFANAVQRMGEKEANRVSARPGQSEHQTGLAMDVSSASVGYELVESFGETIEGKWLSENAPSYGFIIRYPKGKEYLTGYRYEPWHLRYVGVEHARKISQQGLTLEEYLGA